MYIVYEEVEGVKWRIRAFDTEAGAKRSITAMMKRRAKQATARSTAGGFQGYGYMTAEDWANRTVPMRRVRSLMSGEWLEIPADTPAHCDPSTESYWSS